MIETAGFVAAFRGQPPAGNAMNSVLKIIHADGTASNHAVDVNAVRRLGWATGLAAATELYPSLVAEQFFPDLARAVREDARATIRPCQAFAIAPAPRAIVMAVPLNRSDVFLLFADIDHRVRAATGPLAIVLIAGTTQFRPLVVSLFGALRAANPAPCSLFFTDTPAYVLYLLPEILISVGATKFAFVAAGVYLTEAGWSAASTLLEEPSSGLAVLEIEDERFRSGTGCARPSASYGRSHPLRPGSATHR